MGVEIAALQSTGEGRTEVTDSVILEKDEETLPTMTLALNAQKPMLQLVARSALNPKFTVQYYANLEVTDRDDGGYLEILNTDNGGNNKGIDIRIAEAIRRLPICTLRMSVTASVRSVPIWNLPSSILPMSMTTSVHPAYLM